MASFQTVSRESLWLTVYSEIRNAILNGDFHPGDSLRIREIAEQMGVSATPVRDALLQLVMEKVLVMPSKRQIIVPMLSREEVREVRTLRVMLEGHAAEVAAEVATDAQLKKLEEINEKTARAFEQNKLKKALTHNRAFHASLYGIANMPIMVDVLDRLWLRTAPLIGSWSNSASTDDFTSHHYAVINALKAKDSEGAKKAISDDIIFGGEKIEQAHFERDAARQNYTAV